MKRIIFCSFIGFIIWLILTSSVAATNEKETTRKKSKKSCNDVAVRKEETNDAYVNILEEKYFQINILIRYIKYSYDTNNRIILETEISVSGQPIRYIEFQYIENRLWLRRIYDGDKKLKSTKTYHYKDI